jgi:DNA replication protein DnaC
MRTCPFNKCDGDGFVVDEVARVARACRCRPQLVSRQHAALLSARIPKRYREVSFDRPPVPQIADPVVRAVRRYVRNLDTNLSEGHGLWFHGPSGTGKTTLAMLVAKVAMEAGHTVAIYSMPRLLSELRTTYRDDAEIQDVELLDRLANVELLVIDDLGTERRNDWVLEQLYVIINARYEEERPLVVTTNVIEPDELAAQVTPRVLSRLEEMCEMLPLWGKDARAFRPEAQSA